ncbi:MAG: hypothetical protein R3261_08730, partial [Alphaproteobacteria bacterium]|nr:hypothetical protein [Alphaproteobacteria bacterium]
ARALILFGLDLGSADPDNHHSKDTVYHFAGDDVGEESGVIWKNVPSKTPNVIPVEGAFKDVIYTNRVFLQAKLYFDHLFSYYSGVTIINCSDGVKLAGVTDVEAEQLVVKPLAESKNQLIESKLAEWPFIKRNEMLSLKLLDQFNTNFTQIVTELKLLTNPELNDHMVDMYELTGRVAKLALIGQEKTIVGVDIAPKAVMLGTLIEIFQAGLYISMRAQEGDEEKILHIFKVTLQPYLDEMHKKITDLIGEARLSLLASERNE